MRTGSSDLSSVRLSSAELQGLVRRCGATLVAPLKARRWFSQMFKLVF